MQKVKIKKIKSLGKQKRKVYDIGMKNSPHMFFANGILVHNSLMLSSQPLLEKAFPDKWKSNPVKYSKMVCSIVQDYINAKMENFAKDNLCIKTYKYGHKFHLKHEWIADAGLFTTKKRYGLHILWEEGATKDKMVIKGMEIVRSSYPQSLQKFLKKVLKMILKNKSKELIDTFVFKFREHMKKEDNWQYMARPTGVNNMEDYYNKNTSTYYIKGTPVHVKAAINYNRWIEDNNLSNKYQKIQSGEKIRWVYLKPRHLGFSEIAFKPDELPKKLKKEIGQDIDYEKMFKALIDKKIKMLYKPLGWNGPINIKNSLDAFF